MSSQPAEIRDLLATGRLRWSSGVVDASHQSDVPHRDARQCGGAPFPRGFSRGEGEWSFRELAGRIVELTGGGPAAVLTAAAGIVLDAQRLHETVAWITRPAASFFPPDFEDSGIDLGAVVVVRVAETAAVLRAADHLLRSGAFGLAVLDLVQAGELPLQAQVRLAALAKHHGAAVVCLGSSAGQCSEGQCSEGQCSLASLRASSRVQRVGVGRFRCTLSVRKDKRRGREWECAQVFRGAMGLR